VVLFSLIDNGGPFISFCFFMHPSLTSIFLVGHLWSFFLFESWVIGMRLTGKGVGDERVRNGRGGESEHN